MPRAFVVIASVLLIASLLFLPTSSSTRAESTFTKIGAWSDGSTETVNLDSRGQISLNGKKTVAFGLNIVTIRATDADVTSNKVLDTLEEGGIRFMALDISSWLSVNEGLAWVNFWMSKLYEHKMWVALYIQQSPNDPPILNVMSAFARISSIIDGINNQTWANIIFAIGYNWELDLSSWNLTDAQVETFLSSLYPLVREKVDSSIIGADEKTRAKEQ